MKVPSIILKTTSYLTLCVVLVGAPGFVGADEQSEESATALRTEVKAALASSATDTSHAAESVAVAVAAEIIASGLKTEILKKRLDADSRPSKVVALETGADTASGQADQT